MEHRFIVFRDLAKWAIPLLLFLACLPVQAQPHTLVLVAHKSLSEPPFTSLELRKLFLGAAISRNTKFTPLINGSTPLVKEIFVQSVMAMSPRNFERQLLRSSFSRSRLPAKEIIKQNLLWPALTHSPAALSFSWQKDLPPAGDFQIVQILWQGEL